MRLRVLVLAASLSGLAACGDDDGAGSADGGSADEDGGVDLPCLADPATPRRVVTADWLNRSLTVLSYERLLDEGCDAADVVLDTIDLGAHAPGPLQLAITPDGAAAVVAVGPGFFTGMGGALVGGPDVPAGGTLLVVDLATGTVTAELATAHVPMSVVVSPDGAFAYTANFGEEASPGRTVSVVDLAALRVVDDVDVGPGPEQIALSDDGTLGIVNVAGDGGVRVFDPSDLAGTLSPLVATGADPSGVAIVGTPPRFAVVANSLAATYTIVDVRDPAAPAVLESVPYELGAPYGADAIAGTSDVLLTGFIGGTHLVHVHLDDAGAATVVTRVSLPGDAVPLGSTADGLGHAFVAHPSDHALSVVDLDRGQARAVRWLEETGPSWVELAPP